MEGASLTLLGHPSSDGVTKKTYRVDILHPPALHPIFSYSAATVLILFNVNLSLNQTLLTFWLYVRQTGMIQLILAISLRGFLPLMQKDSIAHTQDLVAYVKEGLPFAQDLLLQNSLNSYLCFQLALLYSVSYFFFLYRPPSLSLCMVFDSISSIIDAVLSINPSANVFVFGDFNIHHKDWLTYSGRTQKL